MSSVIKNYFILINKIVRFYYVNFYHVLFNFICFMKQKIIISSDDTGRRIDNVLHSKLKGIPINLIYRLLRKGKIIVNKLRVKPSYKLEIYDEISIPILKNTVKKPVFDAKKKKIELINQSIIYHDNYFIALNKPSGIAVHGGSKLSFGIIECLRFLLPKFSFLELVHRLDRDTSGILLIAKKRSFLRSLHEQFRVNKIKKYYLTLVYGKWPYDIKEVDAPLIKKVMRNGNRMVCVSEEGKFSKTIFKIQERFSQSTLIKVHTITGRTHQIRVHTQYAGHPIAFDQRYGNFAFNQKIAKIGLKRLFLHASSIIFIHPQNNKKICITAPLHDDLKDCIEILRNNKNRGFNKYFEKNIN